MQVVASPRVVQTRALAWRAAGKSIAFVPTMGALHRGHLDLVRRARRAADICVVSIYVNPAQFGPREDLSRYPRPRRADLASCAAAGVDLVFAPRDLYAPDHSTWIVEEEISCGRCGDSRPGHFRGVATVVAKLFLLVQPHTAFFGEKDYQQLEVIRRTVRDLNLPVRIVGVPTVRDPDGLALSSRNAYLSPAERSTALHLPRLLRRAARERRPAAWLRRRLAAVPGIEVDYVELVRGRLCAAIRVGATRLIDNIACAGLK